MCGRVTLFIGNGVTNPRLIRTIPEIHIAIPAGMDRADLRKVLSPWLDADQRACALAIWKRVASYDETVAAGGLMLSCGELR